jgi:pimeloyl-ACP methyl ester carboxylesterase
MPQHLYILTGLGADESVFQRLDFTGFAVTYIQWIPPKGHESMERYAYRLLGQIKSPRPVLVGLSFGGIMAVEIAKQIEVEKVILIASAKTKYEIPFYYRFAGMLRLHRILPASSLKSTNPLTYWFFGASTASDRQILRQILLNTDPVFLKWALDKIVRWQNQTLPSNLFHIHGTSDRILPACFAKCDATVKNGGHLMTLTHAEVLSNMIREC